MIQSTTAFFYGLSVIVMGILLSACNSDPLPAPTRTGNNTFGCKINGTPWIPDGSGGFMPIKPITGGFLSIPGLNYKRTIEIRTRSKDKTQLVLFVEEAKTGVFDLNMDTPTRGALTPRSYGLYRSPDGVDYVTSSAHTGKVTITRADTVADIISGTFFFEASDARGNVVKITAGRFDRTSRP